MCPHESKLYSYVKLKENDFLYVSIFKNNRNRHLCLMRRTEIVVCWSTDLKTCTVI